MAIGIPPTHPSVTTRLDPAVVSDGIARMEAAMKDAGYEYTQYVSTPEDDISTLIALLKRKKYDGVLIGFGVRGSAELTPWFEQLVNLIIEHSPGTKLMFNTPELPLSLVEAVQRSFPAAAAQ